MLRLFFLIVLSFLVSILCFAAIKGLVVAMALFAYGGRYSWGIDDMRFILIRGACLGVVFSTFMLVQRGESIQNYLNKLSRGRNSRAKK